MPIADTNWPPMSLLPSWHTPFHVNIRLQPYNPQSPPADTIAACTSTSPTYGEAEGVSCAGLPVVYEAWSPPKAVRATKQPRYILLGLHNHTQQHQGSAGCYSGLLRLDHTALARHAAASKTDGR